MAATDHVTTLEPGLTEEEIRAVVLILVGVVAAFAIGELVRRVEFRFARRHPLLAELVEGSARRPWRAC